MVRENHSQPDTFNQTNGTFASDHFAVNSKLSSCVFGRFSRLVQWRCPANTDCICTLCPSRCWLRFQIPFLSHCLSQNEASLSFSPVHSDFKLLHIDNHKISILYSPQQEIKAVVRSYTLKHNGPNTTSVVDWGQSTNQITN